MKRAVLSLLLNLTICAIYAQSQPVSQRLDALLNEEILKTSEVGITVFDLTTGESIFDMSKFADEERTVRDATQITMLVENFRKYNLQWAPSDSTGQEYTYKDGIEYHQMCLGVLTEKQKARNERYGDYDEDEDE